VAAPQLEGEITRRGAVRSWGLHQSVPGPALPLGAGRTLLLITGVPGLASAQSVERAAAGTHVVHMDVVYGVHDR
jgi:hypothetical protein